MGFFFKKMPHCIGGRYEKPRQKLNIRSTSYLPCFEFVFNSYSPCFLWPDPLFFFLFFFWIWTPFRTPPNRSDETKPNCCVVSHCVLYSVTLVHLPREGETTNKKKQVHANTQIPLCFFFSYRGIRICDHSFYFFCFLASPSAPFLLSAPTPRLLPQTGEHFSSLIY